MAVRRVFTLKNPNEDFSKKVLERHKLHLQFSSKRSFGSFLLRLRGAARPVGDEAAPREGKNKEYWVGATAYTPKTTMFLTGADEKT